MSIDFDGRVAIVTGAGGGLGRSYALELARRGASVVVNDLGGNPDGTGGGVSGPADKTVAEIRAAGGEAVANYDTVATCEGGEAITQTALNTYGTVDIVINNAGILRDKSFANVADGDLRAVLAVHLFGAFFVTQPAFRVMKEKRFGRVLFTTSGAGLFGNFGQSSYAAAKMGLVGLSNVLALEGARYGITANVIAPVAQSRLTEDLLGPVAESLDPELVMPLALYLVSPACAVTHEIFSAGGGHYARVFLAEAPGWSADNGVRPTIDHIEQHMAEIGAEGGYSVPGSASEELASLLKSLD